MTQDGLGKEGSSYLRWGLKFGAAFALIFSLIYLFLLVLSWLGGYDLPASLGVSSSWTVFAVYWVGCPLAGLVVGLLRPCASRSYFGAAITGIFVCIPIYGAVFVGLKGPSAVTDASTLIPLALTSLFLGPLGGVTIRKVVDVKYGNDNE